MRRRIRFSVLAATLSVAVTLPAVAAEPALAATVPALGVGDVRVMEPFSLSSDVRAPVPIVLDQPASALVSFGWAVHAGSAGGADLVLASGTSTIPAGQQATSVPVAVHGDSVWEQLDEVATLEVHAVSGAGVERVSGQIVIRDAVFDGVPVGFVIGDVSLPEPETGSVRVEVPVTLPAPAKKTTSLTWELRSQYTAVVGEDAAAASGTLTLPRQTTSGSLFVTILGATTPEPLETLLLKPLSSSGAAIGDPWGQVRVLRDDAAGVALPWTAPASVLAGPGTTGYFESSIGDWVGGGRLVYDTLATSGIKVTEANGELRINVDGDVDTTVRVVTSGDRGPIAVGAWEGVHGMQYGLPGMDASQGAAGCSSPDSTASFVVDEAARAADGTLDRVVLRFEQFCPGSLDPLRGFVRYVRGDPTQPPPPKDPATYPWQPPAGALPATGSWLDFQSTPGEWVGQGQSRLLSIDAAYSVQWEPSGLQVSFSDPEAWRLVAAMPMGVDRWRTGWFPAAYGAVANPVKAPLSFSGGGRGCNAVTGDLVVDTATHDADGTLTALSLRFTQICDGMPEPLRAALRWTR
jgi:hypothetical protein